MASPTARPSPLRRSGPLVDPYDSFPRRLPRQITELYFGHHDPPISGLHPHFGTFINAEVVWLNHNQLTSFNELTTLSRLRELYLHHNKITSIPPEFTSVRFIRVLVLHSNKLRNLDKVIRQLRHLSPTLEQLDLWGNPLAEEVGYRSRVLAAFPHLKVLDRLGVGGKVGSGTSDGDAAAATSSMSHIAFGKIYRGPRPGGDDDGDDGGGNEGDMAATTAASYSLIHSRATTARTRTGPNRSAAVRTTRSDNKTAATTPIAGMRKNPRKGGAATKKRRRKNKKKTWVVHYDDPHVSHESTQAFGTESDLSEAVRRIRTYRHRCKVENRRPYQVVSGVGEEEEQQEGEKPDPDDDAQHFVSSEDGLRVRIRPSSLRLFVRERLGAELRKTELSAEQLDWILKMDPSQSSSSSSSSIPAVGAATAATSSLPSSSSSSSSSSSLSAASARKLFPFYSSSGEDPDDFDFAELFICCCNHYAESHHSQTREMDEEFLLLKRKKKKKNQDESPMDRYRRKKAIRLARERGEDPSSQQQQQQQDNPTAAAAASASGDPSEGGGGSEKASRRKRGSARKSAARRRRGRGGGGGDEDEPKDEATLLRERMEYLHGESLKHGILANRWDALKRDFLIRVKKMTKRHRVLSSKKQKRPRGDFFQIGEHCVEI